MIYKQQNTDYAQNVAFAVGKLSAQSTLNSKPVFL